MRILNSIFLVNQTYEIFFFQEYLIKKHVIKIKRVKNIIKKNKLRELNTFFDL
jgi:hypothetical protein